MKGVPRPAVVEHIERISQTYYWLEMRIIEDAIEAGPGQFLIIWLPRLKEIPMSIATLNNDTVSIFFKVVGKGTQRLAKLSPGSRLGVKAPLGRSFTGMVSGDKIMLVAGGTGLAPMIFASQKLIESDKQVMLVWGTPSSQDAEKVHSFLKRVMPRAVEVYVATDDCGYGFCGTAVDLAYELARRDKPSDVVSAGPRPMLTSLVQRMRGLNIDPIVLLEEEVRCGIGMCGSCIVRGTPFLLCVDGPAFRYSSVVSYFEHKI